MCIHLNLKALEVMKSSHNGVWAALQSVEQPQRGAKRGNEIMNECVKERMNTILLLLSL